MARDLVAAGATVPAFLATSAASGDAAARALRDVAGIDARAHLDLDAMLASESLDAIAILSPPETHAHYLRAAARARLPVLCEKPFVWGGPDPVRETSAILADFAANALPVWVNCQWPYTLPAFDTLHPGVRGATPRRFAMALEPMTRGRQSLLDALPHPLSLLQALAPDDEACLRNLEFSSQDPRAESLTIRFSYEIRNGAIETTVRLRENESPPRRAAYTIDGHSAERVVSPESYRLSFRDGDRVVPLADPLTRMVADFVGSLRSPGAYFPSPPRRIHQRMQFLAAIVAAYAPEEVR